MKTALILIDIQNDYFEGGKFELYRALEAATNAEKVLNIFRQDKLPIYHIQHINDFENAPFFCKNSFGAEIFEKVKPLSASNEKLIVKHYPNSFLNTTLKDELVKAEISDVVICGMMTHMCIDTTVRACFNFGLKVTLISDSCTTRDLVFNNKVIPAQTVNETYMASLSGMFANIISADDFIKSFDSK